MDLLISWPGGDWQATLKIVEWVVGSYAALLWVTSGLWTYRDVRSRTRDPISQLVGVALVSAFPLVGLPLYLVLRPRETLQQAYDRQLEQESILSELHSVSACPNCRRPVQDDFMVCPHCRTSLKQQCGECSRLLAHAWRHCPYCGARHESSRSASRLQFGAAESGDAEAAEPKRQEGTTEAAAREPATLRPARRAGEEPAVQ